MVNSQVRAPPDPPGRLDPSQDTSHLEGVDQPCALAPTPPPPSDVLPAAVVNSSDGSRTELQDEVPVVARAQVPALRGPPGSLGPNQDPSPRAEVVQLQAPPPPPPAVAPPYGGGTSFDSGSEEDGSSPSDDVDELYTGSEVESWGKSLRSRLDLLQGHARARARPTLDLLCGSRREEHMQRLFEAVGNCESRDGPAHRWKGLSPGAMRVCDLCEGQPALTCAKGGCGINACRACAVSRESVRAAVLENREVVGRDLSYLADRQWRQPPNRAALSRQGRPEQPNAGSGGRSSGAGRQRGRGRGKNPAFKRGPQA